jgi:hypothetical protein
MKSVVGTLMMTAAALLFAAFQWLAGGDKASRPTKRAIVSIAIAVAVAGAILVIQDQRDKDEIALLAGDRTAEIHDCITKNNMDRAEIMTTLPSTSDADTYVYKRCESPKPSWADSNGYSEIKVSVTEGPSAGEASDANVADTISATCALLRVGYTVIAQGEQGKLRRFKSELHKTVFYTGETWPGTDLAHFD